MTPPEPPRTFDRRFHRERVDGALRDFSARGAPPGKPGRRRRWPPAPAPRREDHRAESGEDGPEEGRP